MTDGEGRVVLGDDELPVPLPFMVEVDGVVRPAKVPASCFGMRIDVDPWMFDIPDGMFEPVMDKGGKQVVTKATKFGGALPLWTLAAGVDFLAEASAWEKGVRVRQTLADRAKIMVVHNGGGRRRFSGSIVH